MILAETNVGNNYRLFEFQLDSTESQFVSEIKAAGFEPATELHLVGFINNFPELLSDVPLVALNSSSQRIDGLHGKKAAININNPIVTDFWYDQLFTAGCLYLGIK